MIWRFPSPLLRRQATSCYINNKITSLPQQEEKLYVRFQVQLIFGAKLKPKSATLIFFRTMEDWLLVSFAKRVLLGMDSVTNWALGQGSER